MLIPAKKWRRFSSSFCIYFLSSFLLPEDMCNHHSHRIWDSLTCIHFSQNTYKITVVKLSPPKIIIVYQIQKSSMESLKNFFDIIIRLKYRRKNQNTVLQLPSVKTWIISTVLILLFFYAPKLCTLWYKLTHFLQVLWSVLPLSTCL